VKLLLDTHLLLWAAAGAGLAQKAIDLIEDPDTELFFSAASIWEVAIKSAAGRPDFTVDATVFRRALLDSGYDELPITSAHAAAVSALPDLHRDPFDRIMIAQASVEGITFLTADSVILQYAGPIESAL
jgi:PIN domain nuclease of toxin-antitoxin system